MKQLMVYLIVATALFAGESEGVHFFMGSGILYETSRQTYDASDKFQTSSSPKQIQGFSFGLMGKEWDLTYTYGQEDLVHLLAWASFAKDIYNGQVTNISSLALNFDTSGSLSLIHRKYLNSTWTDINGQDTATKDFYAHDTRVVLRVNNSKEVLGPLHMDLSAEYHGYTIPRRLTATPVSDTVPELDMSTVPAFVANTHMFLMGPIFQTRHVRDDNFLFNLSAGVLLGVGPHAIKVKESYFDEKTDLVSPDGNDVGLEMRGAYELGYATEFFGFRGSILLKGELNIATSSTDVLGVDHGFKYKGASKEEREAHTRYEVAYSGAAVRWESSLEAHLYW